MTPEWQHIALVTLAYLWGGISPGYWFTRARGVDIRSTGSCSTGATNAGRVLGKRGFYIVAALDILKGMIVTAIACYIMNGLSVTWQFAAMFAVVIGHIWPIWLRFRGGKGVATFYGALAFLGTGHIGHGLAVAVICLAITFMLKPLMRVSLTIAWLAVQTIFPVLIWYFWRDFSATLISAMVVVVIWVAHRNNIADFFHKPPASASAK